MGSIYPQNEATGVLPGSECFYIVFTRFHLYSPWAICQLKPPELHVICFSFVLFEKKKWETFQQYYDKIKVVNELRVDLVIFLCDKVTGRKLGDPSSNFKYPVHNASKLGEMPYRQHGFTKTFVTTVAGLGGCRAAVSR